MELCKHETNSAEGISLYIHIPFCRKKCLYCDFPSFSNREKLMNEYSRALAREIDNLSKIKIKSIFIGGGTPTYMNMEAWENIYDSIVDLDTVENMEFTVEGNPGSFTKEKFKILKKMGVNRLSIGLQAWQNYILKNLGRIHTVEEFLQAYNLARRFEFTNINVDLMFGLPNQDIQEWRETLKNVVELQPEHISCYSLIIEQNTPFYNMYRRGYIGLPGEDEEREMYDFAIDFLESKGYEQYEISNFSRKGFNCIHNLTYWNLQEYIGCGVSAHSYLNGYRYRKSGDIEQYIKEAGENKFVRYDIHKNSIEDSIEEFMFMGLRKIRGISISEFESRFKMDINSVYKNIIDKHIKYGTLIRNGDSLYLSRRGIQVSNSVMCEFILT
ncbi:MAG: radical SAM family heme chaperone HemW [Clostridium sp.]|uniref:radical SAM family heme chaperone HemW n=1 Tax=Clostridium sp. TaxID=1506 RepID=UPI0025BBCAD6|nr:radical SAM family heme chaperone HemW [Clostridium sp.]MCH3964696.1 radical SAM family heme chaperone HemW [Clostridium sp.]MCI1715167.1 radical SAM family heme chaperone HemW [Clostridium sp.]MCI1799429.1 radical SAM family heme chaperone HemW [Clostridium sp.]MCI1813350.1 radical SAM family heme chaperone HemW [Clostridium sp.]MCI1870241.1 radical SAM family heme chaperone HemW [Clostridium sp.]